MNKLGLYGYVVDVDDCFSELGKAVLGPGVNERTKK
jgi:hypothetical protein